VRGEPCKFIKQWEAYIENNVQFLRNNGRWVNQTKQKKSSVFIFAKRDKYKKVFHRIFTRHC
jgi:hypothetical protein